MKVVIPCVNYADMLAVTLPAWLAVLPDGAEVVVVTSPDDHDTVDIAQQCRVTVFVTDAWHRNGATFNKALAMDEALMFLSIEPGEVGLALDVDVYPLGTFPDLDRIQDGTIYGCARYRCPSPEYLAQVQAGKIDRRALDLIPPKLRGVDYHTIENTPANAIDTASKCLGFFQLFRWRPGIRFGSYDTAGKYDLDFRDQFRHRVGLEDIYVLHLGEQNRANWKGRVLPKWGAA